MLWKPYRIHQRVRKNKKKYAQELLKKILEALHEKRFGDVVRLVDECSLSESELQEFVQDLTFHCV